MEDVVEQLYAASRAAEANSRDTVGDASARWQTYAKKINDLTFRIRMDLNRQKQSELNQDAERFDGMS